MPPSLKGWSSSKVRSWLLCFRYLCAPCHHQHQHHAVLLRVVSRRWRCIDALVLPNFFHFRKMGVGWRLSPLPCPDQCLNTNSSELQSQSTWQICTTADLRSKQLHHRRTPVNAEEHQSEQEQWKPPTAQHQESLQRI